jgi:hypothetical protein
VTAPGATSFPHHLLPELMDWLWSLSGPRRASNAAALPVSPASAQASSVQVNSSASDLSNITLDLSDVLAFEAAVQALKNNQSDDSCLQHAISRLQHLIRSDRELNRSHPFAELPRTRAAKQIVIQVGVTQFVSLVGFQFDIALDILHRIPTFNASLAIPRCGLIQFLQFLPVLICSADDARAMVGTSFLQSLFRIIEHIFSSKPHVDTPPTDNTAKMASIQWIDELSDCIPVLDKLAALPEKLFIIGLVSCALLLRLSKVPSLADDLPVQRLFAWVADISFSENSVSSNKTQFAIKVLREMVAHGGSTSICTSQACFILISNFLNGINSQNPLHSCIASDEFELLRDILRKNPLQARTSMTSDDAWLSGPVFDQFSTYFRASLSRVSASANISAESRNFSENIDFVCSTSYIGGPKSDESCFNLVKAHFAMSQSEVWVEQQLVVGQRALSNCTLFFVDQISKIANNSLFSSQTMSIAFEM